MNILNIDFKQPNIQIPKETPVTTTPVARAGTEQPIPAFFLNDAFVNMPKNVMYEVKAETTNIKNDLLTAIPVVTDGLKRPDRPEKSHLVNRSLLAQPFHFINDIAENIVNIKKGLNGDSNDHDLGRINDFAMKAGALGLAAYLFTKAKTPSAKAMEFIGFGSFFASMALWPKMFIEWPLRAMYGCNFNQKYVDNNGREKRFSQDPQYKPWDLYTDEQLNKLGDRLGIPKDIYNRNEVIKAKANKIELQANTLWMLTAGFATPLMSALMCNQFERFVGPWVEGQRVKASLAKVNKELAVENATALSDGSYEIRESYSRVIDDIFNSPNKSVLTEGEFKRLVESLSHSNDVLNRTYIAQQLEIIMPPVQDTVDNSFIEYFKSAIRQNNELAANFPDKYTAINIASEDFSAIEDAFSGRVSIQTFEGNVNAHFLDKNGSMLHVRDRQILSNLIKRAKLMYDAQNLDMRIDSIPDGAINGMLKKSKAYSISPEAAATIRRLDKILVGMSRELSALNAYRDVLLNGPEAVATNRWKEISKTFIEVLDLSSEEINQAKNEGSDVITIIMKKLEALSSDETKFKTAFEKLKKAIENFDKTFFPDANGHSQGLVEDLKAKYGKVFEKYERIFETEKDLKDIAENLLGIKKYQGSSKATLYSGIDERLSELRTCMYKILHTMDVFRRIESGDMKTAFNALTKDKDNLPLDYEIKERYPNMTEADIPKLANTDTAEVFKAYEKRYGISVEDLEFAKKNGLITETISNEGGVLVKTITIKNQTYREYLKIIKYLMLDGKVSDHVTKLGLQNASENHYNAIMRMLYSSTLNNSSETILDGVKLGETSLLASFKKYIESALLELGGTRNAHNQKVVISGLNPNNPVTANYLSLANDCGPKLSSIVRDAASEIFNSGKWLKRYGGMFGVLVGVTLFSETLFGRMNKEDIMVKKDR